MVSFIPWYLFFESENIYLVINFLDILEMPAMGDYSSVLNANIDFNKCFF